MFISMFIEVSLLILAIIIVGKLIALLISSSSESDVETKIKSDND